MVLDAYLLLLRRSKLIGYKRTKRFGGRNRQNTQTEGIFDLAQKRANYKKGKHVVAAYTMEPKCWYDYLAAVARFEVEPSTGPDVNVCTTEDFTKSGGVCVTTAFLRPWRLIFRTLRSS